MESVDWSSLFVPSGSLLENVVRGRRKIGSPGVSDLLVIVLIADAAQNGMSGEYNSITRLTSRAMVASVS